MHQLLKSLFLRLYFDELLELGVGCRSLAIHILLKFGCKKQYLFYFIFFFTAVCLCC